jgi:chemotaxis protein CheC
MMYMKTETTPPTDDLCRLVNAAFRQAAVSLTELTTAPVKLQATRLSIQPASDLSFVSLDCEEGVLATVHQFFDGGFAGDALFLLNKEDAGTLAELLAQEHNGDNLLDTSGREAVTEVGNIIFNACLGVFSEMLRSYLSFSLPRLHLCSLEKTLRSLLVPQRESRSSVAVWLEMEIQRVTISGYLLLVMGDRSLRQVLGSTAKSTAQPHFALASVV